MDCVRTLALSETNAQGGEAVVFVMSRDQRVHDNHALLLAQKKALELKLPLVVVFCLYEKVGFRAREQFEFMLEGLKEVESVLMALNIPFVFLTGEPASKLNEFFKTINPAAVFFDFSPLRAPRKLQKEIAKSADFPVMVVDTHNIIPVWAVSQKQEYAARTIRPKIHRALPEWLQKPEKVMVHPQQWHGAVSSIQDRQSEIVEVLAALPSNGQSLSILAGEKAAKKTLETFLKTRLAQYAQVKNDPNEDVLSGLSPYFHFGHISALTVALEVQKLPHTEASEAFLEELIVRKELSDNFCFYNEHYDSLEGAADWAKKTLREHSHDAREFLYSYTQLEQAKTHDEAWNAAQKQMVKTGKMHGYMRMYWAKKVLEWTESPEQAVDFLIRLNDFYSLDGGDPNGYTGILWSVAGLHDRPWFERSVYGTIRYMNSNGLNKKFNLQQFIDSQK